MNTENKLKIDNFTKALAECINQAQCAVVDPMAHAEIWKEELLELAKGKEPVSEIDFEQELYKYFGQVKDFTLGMRIAKRFYEMGKNHQEPVSEDLLKELKGIVNIRECVAQGVPVIKIARHFAEWQKEQMLAKAFDFTKEHNIACVLASECLRNHGWFGRERDFNNLFRHLSCVDKLFEGKFSGKTKVIVIKED